MSDGDWPHTRQQRSRIRSPQHRRRDDEDAPQSVIARELASDGTRLGEPIVVDPSTQPTGGLRLTEERPLVFATQLCDESMLRTSPGGLDSPRNNLALFLPSLHRGPTCATYAPLMRHLRATDVSLMRHLRTASAPLLRHRCAT